MLLVAKSFSHGPMGVSKISRKLRISEAMTMGSVGELGREHLVKRYGEYLKTTFSAVEPAITL
jgi:hypothetical protein